MRHPSWGFSTFKPMISSLFDLDLPPSCDSDGAQQDPSPCSSNELYLAAFGGYALQVESLLTSGASVSACSPSSALFGAALKGHVGICKLLLERGHDVDLGTIWGDLPLEAACMRGHAEVVRLLLEAGARLGNAYSLAAMWDGEACLEALELNHLRKMAEQEEDATHDRLVEQALELAALVKARAAHNFLERCKCTSPLDLACNALHVPLIHYLLNAKDKVWNFDQALAVLARSAQKSSRLADYRAIKARLEEARRSQEDRRVRAGIIEVENTPETA
jgi:hypothetical protein